MTNDSMDRLAAAVAREKDVETSAAVLLQTLSEKVAATAGDKDATNDLAAQLNANADALSAAIAANTPAEGQTGDTGQTGVTGDRAQVIADAKASGIFTNPDGQTGQTGQTGAQLGDGDLETEAKTGTSAQ